MLLYLTLQELKLFFYLVFNLNHMFNLYFIFILDKIRFNDICIIKIIKKKYV